MVEEANPVPRVMNLMMEVFPLRSLVDSLIEVSRLAAKMTQTHVSVIETDAGVVADNLED